MRATPPLKRVKGYNDEALRRLQQDAWIMLCQIRGSAWNLGTKNERCGLPRNGGEVEVISVSRGINPYAVEERPGADGVGVGVSGGARLSENVGGQGQERRGQIRAALQKIVHAGGAPPGDRGIGASRHCRQQV